MMIALIFLITAIPYPSQPDWSSIDSDYSTGGALVDIDLDGYIDFITGNGNDMAQNPNRVYYNLGDSLERTASWRSSDIGYNAHISVGDINYDGYPDLAVAAYGDPYTPQRDRFYYNQSGTFQSTPAWRPHDVDNSFGLAFGDVDGDGDLDLAVACGESYGDSAQRAKVYLNNNGVLDTLPVWQSSVVSYFYDVSWVDIDNDGDLDLGLGAELGQNLIYRNNGGVLGVTPYWQSANSLGTLKIAFGDVDNDGDMDMVCANNGQLGGESNCELYLNNDTILATTPAWTSQNLTYYSCVALGDADRDGDLDLAAGGWWESVKVFENTAGTFPTTPTWQWITGDPSNLVCENVIFGDVDNTLPSFIVNEPHVVGVNRRVFYLNNRCIKNISRVHRAAGDLSRSEFCYSYIDGWISIKNIISQPETIWVDYTYSRDIDLMVTNWDRWNPNFLFLNTTGTTVEEVAAASSKRNISFPNPNPGVFNIATDMQDITAKVYDSAGRLVCQANGKTVRIENSGVYFMHIYERGRLKVMHKVLVVR